jgi:hypothetical protein
MSVRDDLAGRFHMLDTPSAQVPTLSLADQARSVDRSSGSASRSSPITACRKI